MAVIKFSCDIILRLIYITNTIVKPFTYFFISKRIKAKIYTIEIIVNIIFLPNSIQKFGIENVQSLITKIINIAVAIIAKEYRGIYF